MIDIVMTDRNSIATARRVLAIETDALTALSESLGVDFETAIEALLAVKGRIILSGVGKSGHVARKISATLASTGTPSLYVHPTEASHGDMGMITGDDAVIALSRSGETKELADLIGYCRRFGVPLFGMTTHADSALGRASNHILKLPDAPEACSETRAPTTSTTLQIALGDAISVALLEAKGFTASDFKTYHPGGSLGAAMASVGDLMHSGEHMPLTDIATSMTDAMAIMSKKGFGCLGILDGGALAGMITDGDIRRHLSDDLTRKALSDIMTRSPKTAAPDELAADCLRRMTGGDSKIMQMFVIEDNRPVGIVHLHDFLRVGLA